MNGAIPRIEKSVERIESQVNTVCDGVHNMDKRIDNLEISERIRKKREDENNVESRFSKSIKVKWVQVFLTVMMFILGALSLYSNVRIRMLEKSVTQTRNVAEEIQNEFQ